jgi:hypothetical protein
MIVTLLVDDKKIEMEVFVAVASAPKAQRHHNSITLELTPTRIDTIEPMLDVAARPVRIACVRPQRAVSPPVMPQSVFAGVPEDVKVDLVHAHDQCAETAIAFRADLDALWNGLANDLEAITPADRHPDDYAGLEQITTAIERLDDLRDVLPRLRELYYPPMRGIRGWRRRHSGTPPPASKPPKEV